MYSETKKKLAIAAMFGLYAGAEVLASTKNIPMASVAVIAAVAAPWAFPDLAEEIKTVPFRKGLFGPKDYA